MWPFASSAQKPFLLYTIEGQPAVYLRQQAEGMSNASRLQGVVAFIEKTPGGLRTRIALHPREALGASGVNAMLAEEGVNVDSLSFLSLPNGTMLKNLGMLYGKGVTEQFSTQSFSEYFDKLDHAADERDLPVIAVKGDNAEMQQTLALLDRRGWLAPETTKGLATALDAFAWITERNAHYQPNTMRHVMQRVYGQTQSAAR